jgi:PKD repeat protein
MKSLWVLTITGMLLLAACSPVSEKSAETSSASMTTASTGCSAQKAAVNAGELSIKGPATLSPGESARYNLSEDMNCRSGQSVSWRAVASTSTGGAGTAYNSTFKKPGEYVVAAQIVTNGNPNVTEISYKTVVTPGLAINGPIVGMAEMEHDFSLAIPAGVQVASTKWSMGDGGPEAFSFSQITHTYWSAGTFTVTATVTLANGDTSVVTHAVQVIPYVDGMECVRDLAISGPSEVVMGSALNMSLYIPTCMVWRIHSVKWNFGDETPDETQQSVTHTYTQTGAYVVKVDLYSTQTAAPFLTITRQITVLEGTPEPDPEPVPVDPKGCSVEGQTRTLTGELYSEERECGVGGKKTMSYRDRITESCARAAGGEGSLQWQEVSRVRELLNEGECSGVACELPAEALTGVDASTLGLLNVNGKYYLPNGARRVFYSSMRPSGSCTDVSESRECSNGTLAGTSEHRFLYCVNGCNGVGPDGTSVTVISGEESVARTCQYGETGIFDIFNQLSDKRCENGQVLTSNTRRGTLKSEGTCPTYNWVGTDDYSPCSADCGGEQTQVFNCRNNNGELAPNERCADPAPVVRRVCDGNPEAVRRTESSTVVEDVGSSERCPANQIGVVISRREVTTTKEYACVDHQVGLASTTVVNGPWVSEKMCRDYVPHRCSQDSLSNKEAKARLQWMMKCRDKVPVIDEFLTQFASYLKGNGANMSLVYNERNIYATFMDTASRPEKPWLAPKKSSGACEVPATAYIAAVCVASCATPEQMVLAQEKGNGRLQYVPFVQAWQQKFKYVATMASQSSMSSKRVQMTPVENWVTELVDSEHDIIELTMQSGGQLRLTPNHPLLTDQGSMRYASDFKIGDNVIRHGGLRDRIVSIKQTKYFGKVYNVFVNSAELHKNVIVTNGYLNGTAFFQNEGTDQMNRRILRGQLLKGVFEK